MAAKESVIMEQLCCIYVSLLQPWTCKSELMNTESKIMLLGHS